jgi:hypothetical protein
MTTISVVRISLKKPWEGLFIIGLGIMMNNGIIHQYRLF